VKKGGGYGEGQSAMDVAAAVLSFEKRSRILRIGHLGVVDEGAEGNLKRKGWAVYVGSVMGCGWRGGKGAKKGLGLEVRVVRGEQ